MSGRRLTTTVTMTALVVVLAVMAYLGYHEATRPLPDDTGTQAAQKCSKQEISKTYFVRPKDVTVSVFNAGARSGFAGTTLQRFEDRGFTPGSVANAPSGTKVRRAKVFTTQPHDGAAVLVARTLGGRVPIEVTSNPMGPGIDVFVGPRMRLLNQHAPQRVRLPKPIVSCVQVD